MAARFDREHQARLIGDLSAIRDHMLTYERNYAAELKLIEPAYRPSGRNLLHYLSLRHHDLRDLQRELAGLGLSSLGRMEAHALAGVDAVLRALHRLGDPPYPEVDAVEPPVDFVTGPERLQQDADALLGPTRAEHAGRIMVTMPTAAASDPDLVRRLVEAGMDVMRINAAHDGPDAWAAMIDNLESARRASGCQCRVLFDLAGPKLRTEAITSAERVLRVRAPRDARGKTRRPGELWITRAVDERTAIAGSSAVVAIDEPLWSGLKRDDVLHMEDSRGKARIVRIKSQREGAWAAEIDRTTYFAEGLPVRLIRGEKERASGRIVRLHCPPIPVHVCEGEMLTLVRSPEDGAVEERDESGRLVTPARIPCSLESVFEDVRPGEKIWFDDGKIGGVIEDATASAIDVLVTHAQEDGSKLAADKGINLPESRLTMPSMTDKDLADLDFAATRADIIGLSFVRKPADVLLLEQHLRERDAEALGMVLKIETKQGFEMLPRILMAALRSPPVGIMVARGDLAVEVGFERLAEVQEEMLWLCEAAHIPVIWATQVLEGLAKGGAPSRAEVTDAAASARAECVMLNKGPYIVETVRFLSDVLQRMQAHQHKKRAMLRKLSVSSMGQSDGEG